MSRKNKTGGNIDLSSDKEYEFNQNEICEMLTNFKTLNDHLNIKVVTLEEKLRAREILERRMNSVIDEQHSKIKILESNKDKITVANGNKLLDDAKETTKKYRMKTREYEEKLIEERMQEIMKKTGVKGIPEISLIPNRKNTTKRINPNLIKVSQS